MRDERLCMNNSPCNKHPLRISLREETLERKILLYKSMYATGYTQLNSALIMEALFMSVDYDVSTFSLLD